MFLLRLIRFSSLEVVRTSLSTLSDDSEYSDFFLGYLPDFFLGYLPTQMQKFQ